MRQFLLALCIAPGFVFAQEQTQSEADVELALVKGLFTALNPVSIRDDREYCGYIGLSRDEKLIATPPLRGSEDGCRPAYPDELEYVIASYHTHGAHHGDYAAETPSGDDMEADEAEGIDGWVATPGGRLWFIDSSDMVASQVCGLGCLPQDKNFREGSMGKIAPSYRYEDLVKKLESLDH